MSLVSEVELKEILPKDGPSIKETKKYLDKYSKDYIVIKMGGSVLSDKNLFNSLLEDIVVLKRLGLFIFLVHGGGLKISTKLNELNIKNNFINGLRVTDEKTINVVEDVLVKFNNEIVNALKRLKCKAKSITSKECNIITVKQKNKILKFVGEPTGIRINILKEIINNNEIPVIASLGLDENKRTFNINADTAAGSVAKKLGARRLLIISDVEGVLDNQKKLITEINLKKTKEMIKEGIISGGMIPKIKNCLDVAKNGVKAVCIIDGRKNHSVLFELLSDKGSGTLIRA